MLVEAPAKQGPGGMFLFDTGANRSLLSLDFAGTVPGVTMTDAGTVRGFAGVLRSPKLVRGLRLKYQDLETLEAGPVNAVDLTQRSRLGGVEVAGYLGLDLLGRASIVVDTNRRRLRIARSTTR